MAKAKKVSYQLIPPDAMPAMYELLNELIVLLREVFVDAAAFL